MGTAGTTVHREPWNKGKLVGQKAPFKLKDIWALRVRLQMESRVRELALFNLGIDSKLRGCDLVGLKVRDVCHGDQVAARAIVVQHKTQRPVQFEITPAARDAVQAWIRLVGLKPEDYLFPTGVGRLGDRAMAIGVDLGNRVAEVREARHVLDTRVGVVAAADLRAALEQMASHRGAR
jgi:site-specific recombinase XerC